MREAVRVCTDELYADQGQTKCEKQDIKEKVTEFAEMISMPAKCRQRHGGCHEEQDTGARRATIPGPSSRWRDLKHKRYVKVQGILIFLRIILYELAST